jgi:thermostable 8-oxoguanine DNA glycosylase
LCGLRRNAFRFDSKNPDDQLVLKQHLAFTLMVPGGRADRAREAVNIMTARNVFSPDSANDDALWVALRPAMRPLVRFYKTKLEYVRGGLRKWDELVTQTRQWPKVAETDPGMRPWLTTHIKGMGLKAASHFMRNVGLSRSTTAHPIIDVHIHKALDRFNFEHDSYATAEQSFAWLSKLVDVPVLTLDTMLWCAYANNWEMDTADFDNFGAAKYDTESQPHGLVRVFGGKTSLSLPGDMVMGRSYLPCTGRPDGRPLPPTKQ